MILAKMARKIRANRDAVALDVLGGVGGQRAGGLHRGGGYSVFGVSAVWIACDLVAEPDDRFDFYGCVAGAQLLASPGVCPWSPSQV